MCDCTLWTCLVEGIGTAIPKYMTNSITVATINITATGAASQVSSTLTGSYLSRTSHAGILLVCAVSWIQSVTTQCYISLISNTVGIAYTNQPRPLPKECISIRLYVCSSEDRKFSSVILYLKCLHKMINPFFHYC